MQTTPSHCRHCAAALGSLERLRGLGVCGSAKCRHAAAASHGAEVKSRLNEQAQLLAQEQLPGLAAPAMAVVWLLANDPEMVPVSAKDRQEHESHLQQVLLAGPVEKSERLAPPSRTLASPSGLRLCGQCRGRCCQPGAGWHAFIDLDLMQRWQTQHPGTSPEDALANYMGWLPTQHVFGACLYQTEQGCAIPQQQRSDTCNDYACDALEAMQQINAERPADAVIALTLLQDRVQRAAVIEAGATHRLQWPAAVDPGQPSAPSNA